MLQIRSIVLRGKAVKDAIVSFEDRANILAGDSDTGKSYLVHCLDYIFGAKRMSKRIEEAEPYSQLFVEFQNTKGEFLTLERSLKGGNLVAYAGKIDLAQGQQGEKVVPKRSGRNKEADVTAVLFEFAGIEEAKLRKNDRGEVSRLTIRTILPLILVDEISVIDERSPVLGRRSFDETARKRAFAYMLSGTDDTGIIASEKKEITNARLGAKLSVIEDMLAPVEQRVQARAGRDTRGAIETLDATITGLSQSLADNSNERLELQQQRSEALATVQKTESQIIAIEELLKQYNLLDERYRTDLGRLDFISEGAYFFDELQEVRCPLCDQLMSSDHAHGAAARSSTVYEAARAEASKILTHRGDLAEAVETLTRLKSRREAELSDGRGKVQQIDAHIREILAPAMVEKSSRLDRLFASRLDLEALHNDEIQLNNLRDLRAQLKTDEGRSARNLEWEPLPSTASRKFCNEVEAVLREWSWEGEGRVEFDEAEYDIKIDGQPRQSHGKGVRAILHSAFAIGLLRYCHSNGRPHLGTVIIDSPLTSYKKGRLADTADGPVSAGIESAFWRSLRNTRNGAQIVIIENKEPPSDVAQAVHFEWFAGRNAKAGERQGFIPPP